MNLFYNFDNLRSVLINSNKGCFWIPTKCVEKVFSVSINSNKGCFWIMNNLEKELLDSMINSNKGCFWIKADPVTVTLYDGLTVTKVVFELYTWHTCYIVIMINSNKGCFWIFPRNRNFYKLYVINSNKGCFWIKVMYFF